ncbi:hypothetical protein JCM21142_41674 [Saccharicrinis fermentans DSM 9555 = JCM 21142]|uniref:Uncharacterized protein n=1 Tax=Saccharicrinis fermentans DSM 9555 = JCM 21142 TaxID=869213 RepID=W7YF08_9BACT|nr:hypothetical protein JCM21142_41674 [Saccharicrinis fermentans DSM 9555 = JCM 21142]
MVPVIGLAIKGMATIISADIKADKPETIPAIPAPNINKSVSVSFSSNSVNEFVMSAIPPKIAPIPPNNFALFNTLSPI